MVEVDFGGSVAFDRLVLAEDLADGQRIDGYRIVAGAGRQEFARGTTVGSQIFVVVNDVRTSRLRIEVGSSGGRLRAVSAHRTGYTRLPDSGTFGPESSVIA